MNSKKQWERFLNLGGGKLISQNIVVGHALKIVVGILLLFVNVASAGVIKLGYNNKKGDLKI